MVAWVGLFHTVFLGFFNWYCGPGKANMTIIFALTTVVIEEERRMFCYCQDEVHICYFLSKVLTHPSSDVLLLFYSLWAYPEINPWLHESRKHFVCSLVVGRTSSLYWEVHK